MKYLLLGLLLLGCSPKTRTIPINVEILSINTHVLQGYQHGQWVFGGGGTLESYITNDVNVVGVHFKLDNTDFYEDVNMSHALLSTLKDKHEFVANGEITGSNWTTDNGNITLNYFQHGLVTKNLDSEWANNLVKRGESK